MTQLSCPALVLAPHCPSDLTPADQDLFWMRYAMSLAQLAEDRGEVPVGAVLVKDRQWLAEGYNLVIEQHDPTAHAEMIVLRNAGQQLQNYRLIDTTLYVTLEPCPMCASALVHARVGRLVYGAADLKTGAVDSVFNLTNSPLLNHVVQSESGVLAAECSQQLSNFFAKRRQQKKQEKAREKTV